MNDCRCRGDGCPEFAETQNIHFQVYHILTKLVEVFEFELSSSASWRQLELLEHYFKLNPRAFFMSDLPLVCRLFEVIPEKMYMNEVFKEYYEKYLYLAGIPPLMLCASEIINCDDNLKEYFSVLGGTLFYLKEESYRCLLLDSLLNVLSGKVQWPPCYIPLEKLKECACKSRLPQIAGKFLAFAADEFLEKIIKICISMAEFSKTACHRMLEEGTLDAILNHMNFYVKLANDHYWRYDNISTFVWFLLKSLEEESEDMREKLPPPTKLGFLNLRNCLKYFISNEKKIDRNNILAIIFKIVYLFPVTDFLTSGLVVDIVELNLSVENEKCQKKEWMSLGISPCNEDYTFVKLLLMFLPFFKRTSYYGGIQYLRKSNILESKLKMLTRKQSVNWHRDHLDKLICVVVSVMSEVGGELFDYILAGKGLIKYFELLNEEGHGIDVTLTVLRSIIILGRMDKIKSIMIFNRLQVIRAHHSLTNYIETISEKDMLDNKYQLAVAYSFSIIQNIYEVKTNLGCEKLITLSLSFLKRIRKPKVNDHVIVPELPIMMLSCLWNILLCDQDNLRKFIREEGVYSILDLAEFCVWPVKIVALGILSELAEEALAIPFFVTWRGRRNQKIVPFLLEMFREENRQIGAKHSEDCMILDIEFPIMGTEQYKELENPENILDDSPAIADMIGSCRPKIYAILELLTRHHEEEIQKVNEVYKMWEKEYSLQDQLTKVVAENFFALKIAEVWHELHLHFERCDVRPLYYDYEMLSTVLARAKRWGIYLHKQQNIIKRTDKEKEEIRENELYMVLREARLNQTIGAFCELEYIAKCSKDLFRIREKRRKNQRLMQDCEKKTDPNILFHTTFMYDIMVNPVFDQILHIANFNYRKINAPDERKKSTDKKTSMKAKSELRIGGFTQERENSEDL